jgi:hypothetical protein
MANSESILDTVKKLLGFESDYTAFDLDIITHINSVFFKLTQIGVGPVDGFMINDNTATWGQFIETEKIMAVKSYMGLNVRLLFDPPSSSFALESFKKMAEEFEWRLFVHADPIIEPVEEVNTL